MMCTVFIVLLLVVLPIAVLAYMEKTMHARNTHGFVVIIFLALLAAWHLFLPTSSPIAYAGHLITSKLAHLVIALWKNLTYAIA